MSLLHRHVWRETSRKFNRSGTVVKRSEGLNVMQLIREMEFGITVVELRCDACGDVKGVRYVGDSGKSGAL